MTIRIEIDTEAGQWAEVKDVAELNAGDRRAVKAASPLRVDPDTGELSIPGDFQERSKNILAARVLTNWSLPHPLPKGDPAILDRLTMKQLDAIYAGITRHIEAINEADKLAAQDKDSLPTGDSAT